MRGAALILCFLICAGAAGYSAAPVSGQTAAGVRVPFPRDEGILTPYSFELGYPFVTLLYDTLLWRDRDGTPRSWLARSARRSAGGRRLVLDLRKGVRWHDGRPLTAADVVFTFDYVKRRRHLRFTPQLRGVLRVRAVGSHTVTIDLRHPSPGFLDQPLSDLPILPRHLWGPLSPGVAIPPGMPVGSGPYRLSSYEPGEGYKFAANRAYFRGRPTVARIELDLVRGGSRTSAALARGEVDIVPTGLPATAGDVFEYGPEVEIGQGVNYTGTALALNLRKRPFHRLHARRAVAGTLDLERIAEAVGQLPATGGFLHPDSSWAPDAPPPPVGKPASRREMARLGMRPIEVLAPRDDPARVEVARQVVDALRRAGAQAGSVALPRRAFERALGGDGSRPSFQAAVTAISPLASYDPDYLRTAFAAGERLNQTGYRSVVFDGLAERVARTPNRPARLRAVAAELGQLARDVPSIPLAFNQGAFAYRPAAYDGWVSVKGSGALDKRSFLATGDRDSPQPLSGEASSGEPSDGPSIGALGLAALGLLSVAVALSAVAINRRRTDGD